MKRLLALLPLLALSLSGCNASDDSKDKQSSGNESSQESSSSGTEGSSGEPDKDIEYYQIDEAKFNSLFKNYGILGLYTSLNVAQHDSSQPSNDCAVSYDNGNYLIDYGYMYYLLLTTETEGVYQQAYSMDGVDYYKIGDPEPWSTKDIVEYAYWTFFDLEFSDLTFNATKKAYTCASHEQKDSYDNTYEYRNIEYYFEDGVMKRLKYDFVDDDGEGHEQLDHITETYSGYNSTTVDIPDVLLDL